MKTSMEIKIKPIKEEIVSPKKFLEIEKSDIERTQVIPPKFGSKSFGKIRVVYKHIKYKPV